MATGTDRSMGTTFQENAAVVTSLLKNLSLDELAIASHACKSWNIYMKKIVAHRQHIYIFTLVSMTIWTS